MLKFIKENMASIEGVDIYPIISLLIFVTFFTGMIIYVARKDNKEIEEIKKLPLNED